MKLSRHNNPFFRMAVGLVRPKTLKIKVLFLFNVFVLAYSEFHYRMAFPLHRRPRA